VIRAKGERNFFRKTPAQGEGKEDLTLRLQIFSTTNFGKIRKSGSSGLVSAKVGLVKECFLGDNENYSE
jgi:hypothetical protein